MKLNTRLSNLNCTCMLLKDWNATIEYRLRKMLQLNVDVKEKNEMRKKPPQTQKTLHLLTLFGIKTNILILEKKLL